MVCMNVQQDKKVTRTHDFPANHLVWISNHAFNSRHGRQLSRGGKIIIWQKRPGDIAARKLLVPVYQLVLCISFLH